MLPLLTIGIATGFLLGFLSIAAVIKLYHFIFHKKKRFATPQDLKLKQNIKTADDNATVKWLFCWPNGYLSHTTVSTNNAVVVEDYDSDLESGLRTKPLVEESVEAELMRLHNLSGPPRFLFTIVEETQDDLVSEDGNFKSKTTSVRLIDLMRAADNSFQFSPIESPLKKTPLKASNQSLYTKKIVNNPIYECAVEAELNRVMASPPPKFKFLRDAEEKLMKKLELEMQNQHQQQHCSEVRAVN